MARIRDIYDIIDAVAPFSTALDFDNAGLLVGDGNTIVTRALLALDITPAVVAEAASMNANLILSHHPVIFHPLKSLGPQDVPYQLASRGIAALCCHTNLDLSPVCGVNVALGSKLGLRNVRREDVFGADCVLFSGDLEEPLEPQAFAALVKEKLSAPAVKFCPGQGKVQRVFFCSGAGGGVRPPGGLPGGGRLPHRGDEAPRGAGGRPVPADLRGGGPLSHREGLWGVFGLLPAQAGAGHGLFALPGRGSPHGRPVTHI